MAIGCGTKCARGVLITFNLIFWLSGCALMAFGFFMFQDEEKTALFPLFRVGNGYAELQFLSLVLIAIGVMIFLVGFIGCYGAMKEHKSMLMVYLICLVIILGAELVVGVQAMIFQNKPKAEIEEKLKHAWKEQYGMDAQTTQAIDFAQTKFHCCGVLGPSDYAESNWRRNNWRKIDENNVTVTATCCTLQNADEDTAYLNPQPINETLCQREDWSNQKFRHQTGCMGQLEKFIKQQSMNFIFVGCAIAALETFGIVFSICTCKGI